jgi:23S rRNA pseudouridine2457 synthase
VLIAFHKPHGVLSQFTPDGSPHRTLADFGFPKNVYPLGRLDADSEGLMLLSEEAGMNERLLHPRHAHEREYWAQIERIPTREAFQKLSSGLEVQGMKTLPCRAWILEPQPEVRAESASVDPTAKLPPSDWKSDNTREEAQDSLTLRLTPTGQQLPPRDPPIRFRKNVPTCWLGLELIEGKNRQVRRMTAAIGHPTLRLIRVRIGGFWLGDLPPGRWKELGPVERAAVFM